MRDSLFRRISQYLVGAFSPYRHHQFASNECRSGPERISYYPINHLIFAGLNKVVLYKLILLWGFIIWDQSIFSSWHRYEI